MREGGAEALLYRARGGEVREIVLARAAAVVAEFRRNGRIIEG